MNKIENLTLRAGQSWFNAKGRYDVNLVAEPRANGCYALVNWTSPHSSNVVFTLGADKDQLILKMRETGANSKLEYRTPYLTILIKLCIALGTWEKSLCRLDLTADQCKSAFAKIIEMYNQQEFIDTLLLEDC
jgi:hypothetical protein